MRPYYATDKNLEAIGVKRATYYRWKFEAIRTMGLSAWKIKIKAPGILAKQAGHLKLKIVFIICAKYKLFGKQKIAVMYEREYKTKIL